MKHSSKIPSLEKHLTELDFQVKEDGFTLEDGLEDDKYVLYNDMTFNWRAFRIARTSHLTLLDKLDPAAKNPTQCLLQKWRASKSGEIESPDGVSDEDKSKVNYFVLTIQKRLIEGIVDPEAEAKRMKMDETA